MWKSDVNTIIEDMKQVDANYKPSNFWQHGAKSLQEELLIKGIENFRSMNSALSYFVPTYMFNGYANQTDRYKSILDITQTVLNDDLKAKLIMQEFLSGKAQAKSDYRVFKASGSLRQPYTENFSESKVGKPFEHFKFDNKNYSRSSLNYLLGLNFIKKHIKNIELNTVLEIGGGFGSLGEILLSDPRNNSFYINVDIPPTCLFSSYYLKEILGEKNVANYSQSKQFKDLTINSLRENYKAAILCPWQLPKLSGEIDLFVNFISFQEMEPEIVQNYLNNVSRLKSKYVLLRNLREGKQIAKDSSQLGVKIPIKGDDYDVFLPDYELLATNVHPFGFETIDGFNSELRLYKRK